MTEPAPLPSLAQLRPERLRQQSTNGLRILRNGPVRFVNPHNGSDGRFDDDADDGQDRRRGSEDEKKGQRKGPAPGSPKPDAEAADQLEQNEAERDKSKADEDPSAEPKTELEDVQEGKPVGVNVDVQPAYDRQVVEFFVQEEDRAVATFPVDAYWHAKTADESEVAAPGFLAKDYAEITRHFEAAGAAFRDVKVEQPLQLHGVGFGVDGLAFYRELIDARDSQCTFLYLQPEDLEYDRQDAQWRVGPCATGRVRALLDLARGDKSDVHRNHFRRIFTNTTYSLTLSPAIESDDEDGVDAYRTIEEMVVWLPTRSNRDSSQLFPTDRQSFRFAAQSVSEFLDDAKCEATLAAHSASNSESVSATLTQTKRWLKYYEEEAHAVDPKMQASTSALFFEDLFKLWWCARWKFYFDIQRSDNADEVADFQKVWNAVVWSSPAAAKTTTDASANVLNVARLQLPLPMVTVQRTKLSCPNRAIVQTAVLQKSSEFNLDDGTQEGGKLSGVAADGTTYLGLLFERRMTPLLSKSDGVEKFCNDVAQAGMRAILQVLEVATASWSATRFSQLHGALIAQLDTVQVARVNAGLDEVVRRLSAERDALRLAARL